MELWRYLEEDGVSASSGLAADEYLMRLYECGGAIRSPTLRLYTYRSHCALVGQFQDVDAELDVHHCQATEIPINRRPTGGGAILMGEDQLGMALATSTKYAGVSDHPRVIFARYAAAILHGLKSLGIKGSLSGKNDILVNGRKIAGLGLCRGENRALLFHASLLVDLDIALMLRVLKIPREKLSDKIHGEIEESLTTVRREVGWRIGVSEVRDVIRRGFQSAMAVVFSPQPFSPEEREGVRALEKEKYLNEAWIYQRQPKTAVNGVGLQKTPGGLLRITVSLTEGQIGEAKITGDFFGDDAWPEEIADRLRRVRAEEGEIKQAIAHFYSERTISFHPVTEGDLLRGIMAAVQEARGAGRMTPYGCFVGSSLGA